MSQIKLLSDDGQVFEVSPQIYKCFKTINSMVEDPFRVKKIEEVVLVPDVNAKTLCKVLEWAEYHMDDDLLDENDGHTENICEWDRKLLQVEKSVLIELVLAANYLGIQGLLDITSRAVIDSIKKSAPRNIEDAVRMDDDFVAEQNHKEYISMSLDYDSDSDDEEK